MIHDLHIETLNEGEDKAISLCFRIGFHSYKVGFSWDNMPQLLHYHSNMEAFWCMWSLRIWCLSFFVTKDHVVLGEGWEINEYVGRPRKDLSANTFIRRGKMGWESCEEAEYKFNTAPPFVKKTFLRLAKIADSLIKK